MRRRNPQRWIKTVTSTSTNIPPGLFTRDAATIARTRALPRVSPKGPVSGLKAPRVRDIMTYSVVTFDSESDLTRAGLLMFERRIGCLPVMEHGTLVGIVTERDVFDAFRRDGESPAPAELYLG